MVGTTPSFDVACDITTASGTGSCFGFTPCLRSASMVPPYAVETISLSSRIT